MHAEQLFQSIYYTIVLTKSSSMDFLLDDPWTLRFMESINERIDNQRALSTNQTRRILSIIEKVREHIPKQGICTVEELDRIIANPTFGLEIYESSKVPNEVRHIGSNYLAFRFKYNPDIMREINSFNDNFKPYFVRDAKIWVVPVVKDTITGIESIISRYRFSMDDACKAWLVLAKQSVGLASVFAVSDDLIIANICDNEILGLWAQFVIDSVPL